MARALHRAVLAALAAPTVLSCGQTSSLPDANQCTTIPSGGAGTNACEAGYIVSFYLVGPPSACNPNTGGVLADLPSSQCFALCPPQSNDASTATEAISCQVEGPGPAGGYDGGPLPVNPLQQPASVECTYVPQPGCRPGSGRRPEGLAYERCEGPDEGARFLAELAHHEAASVDAFERLTSELEAHRAPARLRTASRRAARDEVRHTRWMKKLALCAGARVPPVRIEPARVRSLEEVAVENAVEGCVRETFGAAVALIQAERAGDARVRRAMRRIARDETRHAELSWAVARWIDARLDAAARLRVREARAGAVEALAHEVAREPDASLTGPLGVPSASQARALLDGLQATLWSKQGPAWSHVQAG